MTVPTVIRRALGAVSRKEGQAERTEQSAEVLDPPTRSRAMAAMVVLTIKPTVCRERPP
jgi:hypothetical protein